MKIITNEQVASLITIQDAIDAMREAFLRFGASGEMQARVRVDAGNCKLSMMGAVIPGIKVAGAKIYTTINGRFTFAVILFSAEDGKILAVMEGDSMTEFRTAAVTALAVDCLARPDAKRLAIFGTGVQAKAHIPALMMVRSFDEVMVIGIEAPEKFAEEISQRYSVPAMAWTAAEAVPRADVIVTATRSSTPLFSGELLKPGAFVAAIGSSKPGDRELDDATIERASAWVVEWLPQAKEEAGDFILCRSDRFDWEKVEELASVVSNSHSARKTNDDIIIYKGIGVGLEDVALADVIYKRFIDTLPCQS
jgi:ornithine cyclodeaminase